MTKEQLEHKVADLERRIQKLEAREDQFYYHLPIRQPRYSPITPASPSPLGSFIPYKITIGDLVSNPLAPVTGHVEDYLR